MATNLTTLPATPLLDEYCQLFSDWRQKGRHSSQAAEFLENCQRIRGRASGLEEVAISHAIRLFSADSRRTDHAEVARQAREAVYR